MNQSLVTINFSFTFMHYRDIAIALSRNLFQSFRPLIILFMFGQVLKVFTYGVFTQAIPFVAVASFYAIFFFEVFYTILTMGISFLFVALFYNNLYFRGARPQRLGRVASAYYRQAFSRLQQKHESLSNMVSAIRKL